MFRLSFGFALALLSVACGPPTSGGGGGGGSQRGGTSCVVDTECSAGEVCQNGSCIERSGCRSDSDCGNGQMCTNNECVDASPACDDIRDRAAGEICEDNQCQPQGASCTADRTAHAARSAATVAANAGTAPAAATTTVPWVRAAETDNASPRAAVTSACEIGTVLRGRSAKRQLHRGREGCTQDRDCNVGQACQNGQCVDVGGGACRTHAQCTAPQVCVVGAGQASGTCQSLVGRRCGGDSDCAFTDAQNATVSGTCESGRCKVRQFGPCTGDADARATSPARRCRIKIGSAQTCRSNSV